MVWFIDSKKTELRTSKINNIVFTKPAADVFYGFTSSQKILDMANELVRFMG
jgi:hypothetical protein